MVFILKNKREQLNKNKSDVSSTTLSIPEMDNLSFQLTVCRRFNSSFQIIQVYLSDWQ